MVVREFQFLLGTLITIETVESFGIPEDVSIPLRYADNAPAKIFHTYERRFQFLLGTLITV